MSGDKRIKNITSDSSGKALQREISRGVKSGERGGGGGE